MTFAKFKDKRGNSYPYLYIDSDSGIFTVVKRVGGVVRKKSLETTDFNTARSKVNDVVYELTHNQRAPKGAQKIIRDYFEEMKSEKTAEGLKPNTLRRIDAVWKYSIEPYFGLMTADDIKPDMAKDFVHWHKRKRPGIQLVNVFKYLGNLFRYMNRIGALETKNLPRLVLPKDEVLHHEKKKGRIATPKEITEILKVADHETKLIVSLGYFLGMRKMEIGALEIERLELKKGRYIIHLDNDDTKTGLARSIPVPLHLNDLISEQLKLKSPYLFPMATDRSRHQSGQVMDKGWVDAKKKAGIQGKFRFHDLRHSCATTLAVKKVNPILATTMLGMSIVTYQKKYLKLTAEDLIMVSDAMLFEEKSDG